MRVLILSHNRSDSDDAYNYRLRSLAAALERAGIGASVAYLGDGALGKPTFLHALKIRRVHGIGTADVLHAGSAAAAFAAAFLPRERRGRLVFDMHGDTVAEAELREGAGVLRRLRVFQERIKERAGLRASSRVIVVSEPLAEKVRARGVPSDRVSVVRNGVDLDLFAPIDPPPSREEPLVAYAGRFDAWQGVDNLLYLASRSGRGFRLRVIGFGDEDRSIEERFVSLSGGQVERIRKTDQKGLIPLLAEADLLLIPRERNGATEVAMPTKFAEYLALGRPVLLTRVGEPAALVEKHRCGIVVESGGEALAGGIRRFAALPPEERRAMGARARALAEREFSWDAIGARYAAFLRELVAEGGRS